MQHLAYITLVVRDYDEAIDFYTRNLNFELIEDTQLSEVKRWVLVRPQGGSGCCLLLAKAVGDEQRSRVGNQTGGRVFLFMHTSDLKGDYQRLLDAGVKISREPISERYGTVLVFEDLYGNRIDLIQPHG